jgi:hypothetical protein
VIIRTCNMVGLPLWVPAPNWSGLKIYSKIAKEKR